MQPRRRPSRRVLVLVGAALVAGMGGGGWWLTRPEPAAAQSTTMTVTRETFKDTVAASGTIEPASQADLSFAVAGTVTRVFVEEGETVRKGEVLAVVDDTVLGSEVTAKESALEAAQARLDDDEDAGASDTQLAADRAAVVNAQAQLAQAQQALEAAALRSTITGTVAAVNLAKGDTVGGSAPGEENAAAQVSVVSAGRFVVAARVATGDIGQVREGLQVEITPTGGTEPVHGTVQTVGRVASADGDGAATFPVTIEVTGRRKDVYAGSSATVEIIVRQVDDVLAVPTMALRQDGEQTYVYTMVDGERVRTPVETGETYGMSTEVVSGLEEGDEVEIVPFTRSTRPGGQEGQAPGLPSGGMVFERGDGPSTETRPGP